MVRPVIGSSPRISSRATRTRVELHAARVREALADVVPVVERDDALAVAGHGDERELVLVDGGHRQQVAEADAAGERLAAVEDEPVAVARERHEGAAARVLHAAPEESLAAVAARQLVGLLGGAEQGRDPGLRVVVAEQVRDRRVAAGDASRDLRRLRVVQAGAAVRDGLLDLQQVELAEQLDLGAGRRVGAIALGGGGAQLGGGAVGGGEQLLEGGRAVGLGLDGHLMLLVLAGTARMRGARRQGSATPRGRARPHAYSACGPGR